MAKKSNIQRIKLSDLIPDMYNANQHTERGVYMVSKSLEKLGAGRSILIDKDNEIIAGNLTAEQAAAMGLEEVIIVPTDGRQLVAVKRIDMDLSDPHGNARQMAYADNQAAAVSIDFDAETIAADLAEGIELGDWFLDWELGKDGEPIDYDELWQGMPEFKQEDKTSYQAIHVHFKNAEEVQEFAKLIGKSLTEKTRSIWYSEQERMDYGTDRYRTG